MYIASKGFINSTDMNTKRFLNLTCLLCAALAAQALELPEQLRDHAVLQQKTDALLWGWAAPGAKVTAEPSWNGKKTTATAGTDGRWEMRIATPDASYTPYTITFTEGKEKKVISDILVGEVWIAAGQSNMEMPMRGFPSQPVEGAAEDIARSGKLRDRVRMAYLERGDDWEPQARVKGEWKVSSPENTPEFSAQGFYFARELNDILDVPVGIICTSYGGTQVQGWLPRDIVERLGFDYEAMKQEKDRLPAYWYSTKYNHQVAPIAGYTAKGFIWNQGESNCDNPSNYETLLSEMVARWRADWGDKDNSMAFYQTENPGFGWFNPTGLQAALIREQQNKAAESIPNSGITCTADLVYPYEVDVIHGTMKRQIGERMAWQAAERQYGVKGMPWRCPTFEKIVKGEDGSTRVRFRDTAFGLIPNCGNVEGFEVAGEDGVYHTAEAKVDWNAPEVILSCSEVPEIKNVRYGFANFLLGNLRNSWNQPAVPFRTDNF